MRHRERPPARRSSDVELCGPDVHGSNVKPIGIPCVVRIGG